MKSFNTVFLCTECKRIFIEETFRMRDSFQTMRHIMKCFGRGTNFAGAVASGGFIPMGDVYETLRR